MSLWERLQAWWHGDETEEAEPETLRRSEEEAWPVARPAEHSFDRDSRWTGTYPA
jgi:hypothetical protein